MNELSVQELIEKTKEAKSAAELIALAKENGTKITPEEAANYFTKLNPPSGSIADEELENVAGGGCYNSDGRLIVTDWNSCEHWSCIKCGHSLQEHEEILPDYSEGGTTSVLYCPPNRIYNRARSSCGGCGHCSASGGYIVCNHPANHT